MSFTRVKPAGWGIQDTLTSSEANALDIDHANAVDKSASGDTVSGILQMSGKGRIVPTFEVGADADTTYVLTDGISEVRIPSTLSAARIYTFSVTGALTGDIITVKASTALTFVVTVKDGGGATLATVSGSAPSGGAFAGHQCVTLLFNGTAWELLQGWNGGVRSATATSNGSFVVPPGIFKLKILGSGGGSGGGGGNASFGGAGGAAAPPGESVLAVTPGESLDHFIGAGGAGGFSNTGTLVAGDGAPGGRSYVQRSGTDLCSFPGAFGAGGGAQSAANGSSSGIYQGGGTNTPSGAGTFVPGGFIQGANDVSGGRIAYGGGGGCWGAAGGNGGSGSITYIWS